MGEKSYTLVSKVLSTTKCTEKNRASLFLLCITSPRMVSLMTTLVMLSMA